MDSRNRLFGFAALAFGAAFAIHVVERAFRVATIVDGPHLAGTVVAESLAIVQFLVLLLASFFAAQAFFFPPQKGHRGLRDAALLATAAYGFGVLSAAFTIQVEFSEANPQAYRISAALDAAFLAVLLISALVAASGLSQPERHKRDYRLGCAGIAFMVANLLALAAGVVLSQTYTDEHGLGTLTAGLNLGTASFVGAVAAGALAAVAFFDATQAEGSSGFSMARRDLLLAAAVGVYGIFTLIGFASDAIIAIAKSGLGDSGIEAAPTWLAALAALASSGAAVCLVAGLQPPFLRALQRLR
jgi:hypothetical protein